ncbi:hypothetical protein RIF29_10178 [Crotalaria pallida]|uniref:Uncharacterized protein n=1 Tax=Crotalaria pallida TaxID=3830 RepID=A0AAN9IJS3_CROPI
MAKKRGRPPKTPSSQTQKHCNDNIKDESKPPLFDLSQLEAEDLETIDALMPKQLESLVNGIELIRARLKGKAPLDSEKVTVNEGCGIVSELLDKAPPTQSETRIPVETVNICLDEETILEYNVDSAKELVKDLVQNSIENGQFENLYVPKVVSNVAETSNGKDGPIPNVEVSEVVASDVVIVVSSVEEGEWTQSRLEVEQ